MAVFSRLLATVASAYGLQALFAGVFVPQANEKYYDLCGATGFLTTTFVSMYYPWLKERFWDAKAVPFSPLSSFAPRQLLLNAALAVWSIRLGSFLVQRAIKAGGDSRFDQVKHQPGKFAFFWFAQATWITLVGLPVYLANAIPAAAHPPLGGRDFVSLALLASSFAFEVTADRQKSAWRAAKDNKLHDEKFITSGLWGISRHPNYAGEIGIWSGMWALGALSGALPAPGIITSAASPLMTYALLRYVSGVPPLEKSGNKKFGNDPKWQEYTRNVPVLFPWGPKN